MDKNTVTYLIACVGSRGATIYIANTSKPEDLCYIGLFYIFVSIHFLYTFFIDTKDDNPVYLRPIHALLYLAFAFYAIRGYSDDAWKILLVDLGFGVSTYSIYTIYRSREVITETVNV